MAGKPIVVGSQVENPYTSVTIVRNEAGEELASVLIESTAEGIRFEVFDDPDGQPYADAITVKPRG